VQGLGLRVDGSGFKVDAEARCRVWGAVFRVEHFGARG